MDIKEVLDISVLWLIMWGWSKQHSHQAAYSRNHSVYLPGPSFATKDLLINRIDILLPPTSHPMFCHSWTLRTSLFVCQDNIASKWTWCCFGSRPAIVQLKAQKESFLKPWTTSLLSPSERQILLIPAIADFPFISIFNEPFMKWPLEMFMNE